ncbi:helix-turn-helix domain protein [mine drainage metagenome]|uniref:Helix-turn-helix domain protein n=1 Tax=mine drainage metagenome TaxID=410659 RepID=A0A1J5QL01_9ZZZZ
MSDPILTLPEVAVLLKVAEKTVYTMARNGQIPAFKVRGQWRFKLDDIDGWIDKTKATVRSFARSKQYLADGSGPQDRAARGQILGSHQRGERTG